MHWSVGDQVTGAESFVNASESVEYKGLAVSQTPGESSSNTEKNYLVETATKLYNFGFCQSHPVTFSSKGLTLCVLATNWYILFKSFKASPAVSFKSCLLSWVSQSRQTVNSLLRQPASRLWVAQSRHRVWQASARVSQTTPIIFSLFCFWWKLAASWARRRPKSCVWPFCSFCSQSLLLLAVNTLTKSNSIPHKTRFCLNVDWMASTRSPKQSWRMNIQLKPQ